MPYWDHGRIEAYPVSEQTCESLVGNCHNGSLGRTFKLRYYQTPIMGALIPSKPFSWWQVCRLRLRTAIDRLCVALRDRHIVSPQQLGNGQHDCALSSLYWAVPSLPECLIARAFNEATDAWPYGGVSNKEFAIALKRLEVDSDYSREPVTLGALLALNPVRCVALLYGHFIPIVDGVIVGRDARRSWPLETRVYCYWMFRKRSYRLP